MNESFVVGICNFNGGVLLEQNLAALRLLSHRPTAIVVCDNNSQDGSADLVAEMFPEATLIRSPENHGGSGGFNQCIRWALENTAADFVMLVDHDARLDKDCPEKLLEVFSDPTIAAAGAAIYRMQQPTVLQTLGTSIDLKEGKFRGLVSEDGHYAGNPSGKIFPVDECPACALMLRVDILRQIGLLDERFFLYCDDVDLHLRMASCGWRTVVVGDARAWHKHGYAIGLVKKSYVYYRHRNLLVLFARHSAQRHAQAIIRRLLVTTQRSIIWNRWLGNCEFASAQELAIEDFLADRLGRRVFDPDPQVRIGPAKPEPIARNADKPLQDTKTSMAISRRPLWKRIGGIIVRVVVYPIAWKKSRPWRMLAAVAITREQGRRKQHPA